VCAKDDKISLYFLIKCAKHAKTKKNIKRREREWRKKGRNLKSEKKEKFIAGRNKIILDSHSFVIDIWPCGMPILRLHASSFIFRQE
jgi:hypothetical protein